MANTAQCVDIFGFTIPVLAGGKRLWSPRFKRFITEKMDTGELTVNQVVKKCKVSKSLVYQWRMQAKGKPVTASDWRAKAVFAPVVVEERPQASTEMAIVKEGNIRLKGCSTKITLPATYPVDDLVKIIRALETSA